MQEHSVSSSPSSSSSSSSSSFQSLGDDPRPEDVIRFEKSLQELKELRAQLHYAADYSETTYLNAKEKKKVMENTREYICRSVVTVVDHLGTVSANINSRISEANAFSDAELRINCLKQRHLACEQYAHKLALSRLRWSESMRRYHRRYLSTPITTVEKAYEGSRNTDDQAGGKIIGQHELEREDLPLFLYTHKPSLGKGDSDLALALPVRDGLSVLSKDLNPTFHFQSVQKVGRSRKSFQGSDILSLIRRTKRIT